MLHADMPSTMFRSSSMAYPRTYIKVFDDVFMHYHVDDFIEVMP